MKKQHNVVSSRLAFTDIIGVGRFRILGGPNSQQAHDVAMTSMQRYVALTSF